MANDKNKSTQAGTDSKQEAPNWGALVKTWNDQRKALQHTDGQLAKLLNQHDKEFTVAGVGVISGVKAKGKVETYYVKVTDPGAPEELTI